MWDRMHTWQHTSAARLEWTRYEMADSHGMYYIRSCMYACLFLAKICKKVGFLCVCFVVFFY